MLALACIPPPMGWSCDHVTTLRFSFSNMDVIDQEAFSFLRQQITHWFIWVSHRQGFQPLSLFVMDAVVQHCHQGVLGWNFSFCTLVIQLVLQIHLSQI